MIRSLAGIGACWLRCFQARCRHKLPQQREKLFDLVWFDGWLVGWLVEFVFVFVFFLFLFFFVFFFFCFCFCFKVGEQEKEEGTFLAEKSLWLIWQRAQSFHRSLAPSSCKHNPRERDGKSPYWESLCAQLSRVPSLRPWCPLYPSI